MFKYATRGILTGLTVNTKYKIWMTASTADEEGERSNVITVQTCKRPREYSRNLMILLQHKS